MRVAGLMSGTSLDGIDAAVVDCPSGKLLEFRTVAYPRRMRERLLAVSNAEAHTREIARLGFELPRLYARALRGMKFDLCGCHGQTVYHEGGRCTLQIGDGSVLAALVGVPVVCDFRPADIAAGGEGAPLVPYLDYKLLRRRSKWRVALNIGGIANLTSIPPGARLEEVVAMATGRGNRVMDALGVRASGGRERFDRDGRRAARGHVRRELLDGLLRDPYYRKPPPKTAGREQYGREFVERLLGTGFPAEDLIATAGALTAATVALAVRRFTRAGEVIVSGGGARNRWLMAQLAGFLPGVEVRNSRELGLDPDAKEAMAFAVMAYETWRRRPSNVPGATGARRAAVLGKVCYP